MFLLSSFRFVSHHCWLVCFNTTGTLNFNFCVPYSSLKTILTIFSNKSSFLFKQIRDIAVVDNGSNIFRFQINLVSVSLIYGVWNIIQTRLLNGFVMMPLCFLFKNFYWISREIWEMFGIQFKTITPRLLSDYTSSLFPLRKEYTLTGFVFQRSLNVRFVIDRPVSDLFQIRSL